MRGERCPEFADAPQTPEGRAVLSVLDRPGVWQPAGLAGVLVGLDLRAAMQSLPRGLDRDFARTLFLVAERPYLAAWHAAEAERKKSDG